MQKKTRKVILFYNPTSGSGVFKSNLDRIVERYQAEGFQVIPIRAGYGHALDDYLQEMEKATYQQEYAQIIAAGGDGTINVCVNSMVRNDIDLPLAVFPAGTANDFAYYFNIPNDIEGMLRVALSGNHTYADVGKVNDRYFINVAAMGQVVDVSQKTDPTLKNTIGVLAYYLKGLSEVPNLKPIKVTLKTPERTYHEKMYFMVVMNGKSAGGFKKISPDSEINDGMLDVMLFRVLSVFEMPQFFMKIVQGKHRHSRKVLNFQTSDLTIECDNDMATDIDGEHGEKFPLKFGVLHNRLKVCTLEDNLGEPEKEDQ